jgi:hypothetical protein
MLRPCLDCGTPTPRTRCPTHTLPDNRPKPAHRRGNFRTRSDRLRATAETCWLCGGGPIPGDPWTADHLIPGDPDSELLPAHRTCNSRRGTATPGRGGRGRRTNTNNRTE